MLVIKIFSKRKKDLRERKKCEKIHAKRLLVEFFDLWKLRSPLDTVVEGLMSNVPNEGSLYKLKLCYDKTKASMLCRNYDWDKSSFFNMVLYLSCFSYFPAMSKNDMKNRICTLSKNDLKDLVKTYCIPLDLHPRFPDPGFTMDCLPGDAICIYFEFLWFFDVRIPFSTFLLYVLKYFKVHISQLATLEDVCMDDGPSSLKKWKDKFFLIDRRAILDNLTWRHSCSCVYDDLPIDGYDRNDVERLCARLIYLRKMREEVLVHSRFSSVWFNKECDMVFQRIDDNVEMCIYDFMTLPSWSDAKIAASLSDSCLAKKSKGPSQAVVHSTLDTTPEPSWPLKKRKLKKKASEVVSNVLELDQAKGVSTRAVSVPIPRLGKRLGAPPSIAVVSASEPSYVGTLAPASTSGCSLSLGGAVVSGHAGKSGAEVMRRQLDPLDSLAYSALARDAEYDQILDNDFGTATRGEEIDLTLFPLAPGPYHMPNPYEGVSSPLHTKEEWDMPYALESNILCKDIFKDPYVCRKALDQTITPVELKRTKSLIPLELSNRVNVLSALLVSHVTSLDNKLEKLQRNYDAMGQENELCSQRDADSGEVKKLQSQLTDVKAAYVGLTEELTQTDAKLSKQDLTVRDLQNELALERSKSQGYKDAMMFEVAAQKVSNFHVAAKADFNKALVNVPTTPFPFLSKIAAASRGTLSEVTQVFPDKHIRSVIPASAIPPIANEDAEALFIGEPSWEGEDFVLLPFHWRTYMFLSFAHVAAYYFIRSRFKFILSASSFSLSDPWIVLFVGMPISTYMTALVPYARLNGVSSLLVLGVVLWAHNTFGNSFTHAPPSGCSLVLIPCIMLRLALSTAPFA
ncbi:hypothetical protein Tco_0185438 [Tanacetum coccineum]